MVLAPVSPWTGDHPSYLLSPVCGSGGCCFAACTGPSPAQTSAVAVGSLEGQCHWCLPYIPGPGQWVLQLGMAMGL